MKEEQDDRWIGKMKELLEDYSPSDAPNNWKQVKRKMNRNLSWGTRLLMFFRRPWTYAIIFGAGILVGYLIFTSHDKRTISQTYVLKEDTAAQSLVKPSNVKKEAATNSSGVKIDTGNEKTSLNQVIEKSNTNLTVKRITQLQTDSSITNTRPADPSFPITLAVIPVTKKQSYSRDRVSVGDTVRPLAATGLSQPTNPDKKQRKPLDLSALTIKGDPWKVGIGYEYLYKIKPDTGQTVFHGLTVRFAKQVTPKLWAGSGLTFGKTQVTRSAKFAVRDWTKIDSLGTIYLRDSSVSYRKWQNHAAIPLNITFDILKNRNFALPLSAGATFGWVYSDGVLFTNDGFSSGGSGGLPDKFTAFITADVSVGYEVFYLRGLSAVLSAEFRRMIAGQKSLGAGQNFIGGRIVLNLDFDKGKWR